MVCFALKATGSETEPTVTWTGLTTGNSGTPCFGRVVNMGTGFQEDGGGLLIVDVVGGVSEQVASATVHAGGEEIAPNYNDTYVFAVGIRPEFVTGITVADTGGLPITWELLLADSTASGSDLTYFASSGYGPVTAGTLVTAHSWTVTGVGSVPSSGVMVSLAATSNESIPSLQYTPRYRGL